MHHRKKNVRRTCLLCFPATRKESSLRFGACHTTTAHTIDNLVKGELSSVVACALGDEIKANEQIPGPGSHTSRVPCVVDEVLNECISRHLFARRAEGTQDGLDSALSE